MKFVIKLDNAKKYRWQLIGDNNSDILADSGQGYSRKEDCLHGISQVKKSAPATIYDSDDKAFIVDGPHK